MAVSVMLPPTSERQMLSEHLRRIGCVAVPGWPIPAAVPSDVDVIMISVDQEIREEIQLLIGGLDGLGAPIIALAEYEDPSTLQLILEMRATAVIERPVKPFGLLTNLMIARDVWRRRLESAKRIREAEERHLSLSTLAVARIILAQQRGLTDAEAHRRLQKHAMNTRATLDSVAREVVAQGASSELLTALKQLAQQEPRNS